MLSRQYKKIFPKTKRNAMLKLLKLIRKKTMQNNDSKQIAGAILVVGLLIAGAILLKGNGGTNIAIPGNNNQAGAVSLAPVTNGDKTLGNNKAKVTIVMYADFQCPFCGAVTGLADDSEAIAYLRQNDPNWTPFMPEILNNYVANGKVQFVYRDWAFLGPESIKSAEAARCAGDQNKFWEYHDYLYGHQNGENKGSFSDINLKSFAKTIGLDSNNFDKCLDDGKYTQAVVDAKNEGVTAGVTGTPKGFILRDGKIVSTIDGAEPLSMVQPKIEAALK